MRMDGRLENATGELNPYKESQPLMIEGYHQGERLGHQLDQQFLSSSSRPVKSHSRPRSKNDYTAVNNMFDMISLATKTKEYLPKQDQKAFGLRQGSTIKKPTKTQVNFHPTQKQQNFKTAIIENVK
jgi:hypothetical protein